MYTEHHDSHIFSSAPTAKLKLWWTMLPMIWVVPADRILIGKNLFDIKTKTCYYSIAGEVVAEAAANLSRVFVVAKFKLVSPVI